MIAPDTNQQSNTHSPEFSQLFSHADSGEICNALGQHLSPRQTEILLLMMQGHSRSKIAAQLNLSVRTVDTVRARMMIKLNAKTNADLVLKVFALLI